MPADTPPRSRTWPSVPDGKRLASSSYDGTVLVWDTTEATRPVRLARLRHRRLVNASAWNPAEATLLATASADKTVAIWRIPDGGRAGLVNVLARHTDDINSVAWMPDGQRLVCASEDGRATMWEALRGVFLGDVTSHAAHCMMVSVSCDGLVATVGEDGMVAVCEPGRPAGSAVRRYASSVEGCAWSHSGKILAVARDDGVVDLLSPQLDRMLTVDVSDSAARTVAWADDDSSFVVGAYDGSLHFCDVTGEQIRQMHDDRLWPRSVSAAQGLVAVGSFWSSPHLLDFATVTELAGPTRPNHGPNALAARGEELLIGCDSGVVVAVDLSGPATSPPVRLLPVSGSPILSLTARGGRIYAGTYSGQVIRCADAEGDDAVVSEQLGAPVPSLCLAGDLIVAGTYNGELIGLEPATLAVDGRGAPHDGSVKSLSTFHDGFLSAATDRTVAAGSLHRRTTLWEHGNLVNAVATLRGRVAATASRDHTVKVGLLASAGEGTWQVEQLQTLLGPDESVKCVGLLGDADAPLVLAGSYDFGLYLWEVDWRDSVATLASGRLLAEFRQGVSCMVRLDERRLAVAGWDGRVLIVGPDDGGVVRALRSLDVEELVGQAARRRELVTR
ncbi:WD40 repeat domain-containing protein [Streptomyces sp. GTA36]